MAKRKTWKRFLEKGSSETDSYVRVTVQRNERGSDVLLKIADCDRRVELNFDFGGGEWDVSLEDRLRKLEVLEEALRRVRAELEAGL